MTFIRVNFIISRDNLDLRSLMIANSLFPEDHIESEFPDGLYYLPDFVSLSDQQNLLQEVDSRPWSLELKRRVQHYGYRYDYKARRIDSSMFLGQLPPFAYDIASSLQSISLFAQFADQLIVNEYLPGQGISAHVDCETCFENRIAIISLAWPYEMEFRDLQSKRIIKLILATGSLLVLANEVRYHWTHQIRPRLQDHGISRRRRVSLTFRKVIHSI